MSRSETLTLHLTPDQMAWVERLAEKANLPVGEVIGLLVLASAHEDLIEDQDVPPVEETDAVPSPSSQAGDASSPDAADENDAEEARATAENVLKAFADPNARTELDGEANEAGETTAETAEPDEKPVAEEPDDASGGDASGDGPSFSTNEEDDESVLASLRNAYKRLNELKNKENKGESTKARLRRLRWLQSELQTVTDERASDEPKADGGSVPGRELIEQALNKMRESADGSGNEDAPTSMFDYPHPEDEKES